MLDRKYVLPIAFALGAATCSPYVPPPTVPKPADPTVQPFSMALQTYVDLTQP